jgi:GNAT superfamily N-acetyltransferase
MSTPQPTPNVRPATKADADAVAALWEALLVEQAGLDDRLGVADDASDRWRNDFPHWIDDGTCCLFVAETEGDAAGGATRLVGFARAHRTGPPPIYTPTEEVFLDELYVAPEARREGVGTRLADAVVAWADDLGADRLRLSVLAANGDGRAFWAAQQATPFSHTLTRELEGRGEDEQAAKPKNRLGF